MLIVLVSVAQLVEHQVVVLVVVGSIPTTHPKIMGTAYIPIVAVSKKNYTLLIHFLLKYSFYLSGRSAIW